MNLSITLLLMIQLINICSLESNKYKKSLSRKKRYLNFPTGSILVVNLSLGNYYVWSPRVPAWAQTFEADLGFRLPNNSRTVFNPGARIHKRTMTVNNYLHRRERLELYRNIESLLDMYGVDGHKCLLRTLCEVKQDLYPGKSFVEDLLHTVFTFPRGNGDDFESEGFDEAANEMFCRNLDKLCPFSLLQHMLS
ncbi:uncharacterized protein [Periplaneta americana]|uniref:uncharacterized protein n=1 Tax=Periplaneta americana TaxID=6978 RepID=UPI0037E9458E